MRSFISRWPLVWLAVLALRATLLAQDAPSILTPPQNQATSSGATVTFNVAASGSEPLIYHWRFNGTAIANATNAALTLTNVSLLRGGGYSAVITNSFGSVTSAVATLSVDEDLTFRILELRTNGAIALEVNTLTDDDRGGMAVGGTNVFLTGDARTARWGLDRLLGGTGLTNQLDALTSDLRTEQAYSLGNGTTPIGNSGGAVTTLIQIDGNTGLLTGNTISLSTSIGLSGGGVGIFAGYGRVVLHTGSRVYSIAVPSGVVTDLGAMSSPTHASSENWAYWGVAEYIGNAVYLVYVQNSQTIARTRVPDGASVAAGVFTNLSDMASFTFSPSFSRWYFHYENTGQFRSGNETLGSAKARFTTDPGYPYFIRNPASVNSYPGSNATFTVLAGGAPPLTYQWRFNGVDIDGATGETLTLTNLGAGSAGAYSVRIENASAASTSADAILTLVTTPVILRDPLDRSAFPGQTVSFSVFADGAPLLSYQWLFNGVAVNGGTNATLVLTNVQLADAGGYSVQITNRHGEATSAAGFLTVITSPEITFQPRDLTVVSGTNATFAVSVSGAPPLSYQWRFNGTDLPGATNASLTLPNVQAGDAGAYSVRVTNFYGSVISSNATLSTITIVDDGSIFQITSLTTNGARAIDCNNQTGDDRGGIAVSPNLVLLTGDNSTARFAAADLSGAAALNRTLDSLCANLRTETVYGLADGTNLLVNPGGVVRSLFELNPTNGVATGKRIALSRPISATYSNDQVGIFSGYDEIVIYSYPQAFRIALPSGQVTDLGSQIFLSHQYTESWAFWGVAEHVGGYTYVAYARDSQSIHRTRFPDGATTPVFSLAGTSSSLSDLASFTVSLPRQRWYFHYEDTGVFRSGNETIGYADATFVFNSGAKTDHFEWGPISPVQTINAPFTVTLAAKNSTNATVTNFSGVVTLSGLTTGGGQAVLVSPTTISNFINGVWTGQITVLQSSSSMSLRADDRAGNIGNSAPFSVAPANDLLVLVTNTPNPALVGNPLTYLVFVTNTGPSLATGVRLTNTLPVGVSFISANASQGQCMNSGSLVFCNLGTVNTGAIVTIIVVPSAPGSITNAAAVARNEVDASPSNNLAVIVTQVVLPSLKINDVSLVEGDSGTNDAVFTVTLSAPATNVVSVAFATSGGNASSSGAIPDYVAFSGVLVFPAGETNQTIAIRIRGDTLYETNDTFNLTLSNPTNATIARGQGVGAILNDDFAPTVTIQDVAAPEGNSGTSVVNFRVRLSAQSGLVVPVFFTTSNGTATAGSDYAARTSFVSFPVGTATLTQNVAIIINGDTLAESNEFFQIIITSVSNAVLGRAVATGLILTEDGSNVLDHFAFAPIATPQPPNTPIPLTLTARDFFGVTMSNFNGTVNLGGLAAGSGFDTNIFGGAAFTNNEAGDYTIGYAFTARTNMTVTHVRHYCGNKITLWTDKGDVVFRQNVISTDGKWLETALPAPVLLTANTRYRLAFYTGGASSSYYYDFNRGTNFEHVVLNTGTFNFGDAFPTNEIITGWAVDLRYRVGTTDVPVPVSPSVTGNFTNGVWSGAVQVLARATNMILHATDNLQHRGTSNPFDTVDPTTTDLALQAVASPANSTVGSDVTFIVTVTNRGAETAFGLAVTVPLPLNMSFVSAIASAASCTHSGNVVTCLISSLSDNESLALSILANVDAPGTRTNIIHVTFAGTDTTPENNTVVLTTTAIVDTDGDDMPDDWEQLYNLNPNDPADAAQDADGDGATNLNEYLANTNPRDPSSFIRILEIRLVGSDVWIRFHGVEGRRYRLEYSENMVPENWTPLVTFRIGSLLETQLIDTGSAVPGRIYRVRQLP